MQLIDIQKLQFSDKARAEYEMLAFLQQHEDPSIMQVELNPKRESLNSINGFLCYENGDRLFFKTHVEEAEKVSEYYNAEVLARAGYPVIAARRVTGRVGKQIALYEIVSLPTLFDLVGLEESPDAARGSRDALSKEQIRLDRTVFQIYQRSMQDLSRAEHASAPVHQLFSHRLAEDGRLGEFYLNKRLSMETTEGIGFTELSFEELAGMHWTINGVRHHQTLGEIIERSRELLAPQAGPSVVGHGDAHNGNVFVDWSRESNCFSFFDPAFAGRHDPLLDLVKPMFHNVFARWMYYPEEVNREFELKASIAEDEIRIEHNFLPSKIRLDFLESRRENVLEPLLDLLENRGQLRADWQDYLRSALFCCPFLTVNLFAPSIPNGTLSERYSPPIKLLGLATAVQFGSTSQPGTSVLGDAISSIFQRHHERRS
ncbi:MAG: aminoglycoside phosphotransferase family protein [Cyanobacteria bacterium]|nr:aminoglycoside phosphotransferase family protein [Cyanobacteriota bacterium]